MKDAIPTAVTMDSSDATTYQITWDGSKFGPMKKRDFDDMADRWERETAHMSSSRGRTQHPLYEAFVNLGPKLVIPWAIQRIARGRGLHCWLTLLDRWVFDPPKFHHPGCMKHVARQWINWGKRHGIKGL